MQKLFKLAFLVFCLVIIYSVHTFACTTILVTKGATEDGSVLVTHSDDNELCDERIIYIPAQDHDPGSWRYIYPSAVALGEISKYNCFLYPRIVATERGPGYNMQDYPKTIPLDSIPQVKHTYAYFDGSYGIMNEHQLMIGECTNGAKIQLGAEPGKRIFYSSELSRIALERCRTARKAVILIGKMIEKHGYYGTGETLLIGDANEGWVFEMCCGTIDSTGGLWVAKKVPDGELFVAANQFRIRNIDPNDSDLIYSPELFKQVEALGWWDPSKGKLDWLKAVSLGEYNHPYYSLRRIWRVMSLVAPSNELSPWVKDGYTKDYPFSIKPDELLKVRDVMALHRDHYEGTEFDMTKGKASGPFGFPNRYYGHYDGQGDVGNPKRHLKGAWERPLSVAYCGYVYVNQARSWLPDFIGGICWMGLDKPSETCFVPFYVGINDLPQSYQVCNTDEFSRKSAWWAFNFVSNWSAQKYNYIKRDIKNIQNLIEIGEVEKISTIDSIGLLIIKTDTLEVKKFLTKYCLENADNVVKDWWAFSNQLIVKYNDGYINTKEHMANEVGYPEWWLKESGWMSGPTSYEKSGNR